MAQSRPLRTLLPVVLLIGLLAGTFLLYTQGNRFPFFYHPDEPDKVEQVITGKWNFHHPILLLVTTRLATRILQTPPDEQTVVVIGRMVSAGFAALGVVAFAVLGYLRRGTAGLLAVGLLLGFHHQIFELAHYLKEDTALLMAMGLSFFALALFWERRTPFCIALLGMACGLSVSAKYLGIMVVIPALVALWFQRKENGVGKGIPPWILFLGGFLGTVLIANFPLLTNFETFQNSFHREVSLVRVNDGGRLPLLDYLKIFVSNTNLAIWLFLGIHLTRQWKNRSKLTPVDWMIILFPFVFMAVLSCSHKTNDRYFLPASALFSYLAAQGICDAADYLQGKMARPAAFGLCLAVACFFQLFQIPVINTQSLSEYYQAFQHDDRAELIVWIRSNLPVQAVLAQDNRVALPTPRRETRLKVHGLLEQEVVYTKNLSDLAPMDQLRSKGITHVAISSSDYGKYYRKGWSPKNPGDAQKKQFYEDLLKKGEILWERPRSTVIYLHPGIQLIRLPAS